MFSICRELHVEPHADEDDVAYATRRWAAVASKWTRADGEAEDVHRERVRYSLARLLNVERRGETVDAYLAPPECPRQTAGAARIIGPAAQFGEEALNVIRKHALGLDAHALRRAHPTVKLQKPSLGDDPAEPFNYARFTRPRPCRTGMMSFMMGMDAPAFRAANSRSKT